MTNNEKPAVIKGLRRLSYADRTDEMRAAIRSPYHWWWKYLRLSKDYWWVCQQQGETLDQQLQEMWLDFGNVFDDIFQNWWLKRGRKLFAEQVRLPHVRQIDPAVDGLSADTRNHVVVEIPLNVTERTIARQVMAIVRAHPNRHVKPVSQSKRQLCQLRGIRQAVLEDAHLIWGIHHVVELAKQADAMTHDTKLRDLLRRVTHHQLGIKLNLVDSCKPAPTDSEEKERKKRNGMKVAVTRMITRANALIANAEIGQFPSTAPVQLRQRWTDEQLAALNLAVANGQWQPPDVSEDRVRNALRFPRQLPG